MQDTYFDSFKMKKWKPGAVELVLPQFWLFQPGHCKLFSRFFFVKNTSKSTPLFLPYWKRSKQPFLKYKD